VEGVNAVEEFEDVKVHTFDMPVTYTAYEGQETYYMAHNWFSK
jgi:hypothetical protein